MLDAILVGIQDGVGTRLWDSHDKFGYTENRDGCEKSSDGSQQIQTAQLKFACNRYIEIARSSQAGKIGTTILKRKDWLNHYAEQTNRRFESHPSRASVSDEPSSGSRVTIECQPPPTTHHFIISSLVERLHKRFVVPKSCACLTIYGRVDRRQDEMAAHFEICNVAGIQVFTSEGVHRWDVLKIS